MNLDEAFKKIDITKDDLIFVENCIYEAQIIKNLEGEKQLIKFLVEEKWDVFRAILERKYECSKVSNLFKLRFITKVLEFSNENDFFLK